MQDRCSKKPSMIGKAPYLFLNLLLFPLFLRYLVPLSRLRLLIVLIWYGLTISTTFRKEIMRIASNLSTLCCSTVAENRSMLFRLRCNSSSACGFSAWEDKDPELRRQERPISIDMIVHQLLWYREYVSIHDNNRRIFRQAYGLLPEVRIVYIHVFFFVLADERCFAKTPEWRASDSSILLIDNLVVWLSPELSDVWISIAEEGLQTLWARRCNIASISASTNSFCSVSSSRNTSYAPRLSSSSIWKGFEIEIRKAKYKQIISAQFHALSR